MTPSMPKSYSVNSNMSVSRSLATGIDGFDPQIIKGDLKIALKAACQTVQWYRDFTNLSQSLIISRQHLKETYPLDHFCGTYVKLQFAWLSLVLGQAHCL